MTGSGRYALRKVMVLPSAASRWLVPAKNLLRRMATTCAHRLLGRSELPTFDELARLRAPTRVLIAAFATWIVLVGFILVVAVVWVELSTVSLPGWFGSPGARGRGTEVRSQQSFNNIVQRPLFLRSRQVVSIEPPQQLPSPLPPIPTGPDTNIMLRGVFISGNVAKAFLVSAQNPAGAWAQTNEEIAGWRVIEIRPDAVLLGGSGQRLAVQYSPSAGK